MYVGKVTNETANRVSNELSFDIKNYNISINSSGINHSYNNHGDSTIEQMRGQVPITENDFENIYDIVNEADQISSIGRDSENHQLLQFEKNIDGNNVFVAYISRKHKNLELKTLYKFLNNKKNPVTAFNVDKSTLNYTSETNSDTDSITNIIPSKKNYVNNDKNIQKYSKNISSDEKNITIEGVSSEEIESISKVIEDKNIESKETETLWNELTEENIQIEERKVKSTENEVDKYEKSPTLDFLRNSRKEEGASFKEVMDAFLQKFVNSGHYVDQLVEKTNNKELKFANDKRLSTFGEAQYSIGVAQTNNKGKEIGKSLIEIFKPARKSGLKNEFNDYLLNKLNLERQALTKSVFGF